MRLRHFILCLVVLSFMLGGCASQWTNPDAENKQQAAVKYERDSVDCEVVSGEKYPLDKHRQLDEFNKCMEDKGWQRSDGQGIPVNFRK